jgi:hypothetical protein
MTVGETATALGIPEATVRTRFFRARGLLRESLALEADCALEQAFAFAGARCARIVAGVCARLDISSGAASILSETVSGSAGTRRLFRFTSLEN